MVADKEVRDIPVSLFRLNRESDVPLYVQLRTAIQQGIASGTLGPGYRLPPEPRLCERLGISTVTVKNAIAPLVDAGLLYRRARLGTFVSGHAGIRAIRVGMMAPHASGQDAFQAGILRGLNSGLRRRGFAPEISMLGPDDVLSGPVDAVALLGPLPADRAEIIDHLKTMARLPPLVLDVPPIRTDADFVYVDNEHAAFTVVTDLIQRGASRILYFGMGEAERLNDAGRLAGYRRALEEAGIALEDGWVLQPSARFRASVELVHTLVEARADAVFFAIGGHYGGLLLGLLRSEPRVEEPLVGGIALSPAGSAGTVDYGVDAARLGEVAADILDRRLRGEASAPCTVAVKGQRVESD
ncbi:MAG: GntR family transcriptional regulator [Kiritimatiellae bacterium]|nr:GntR family transcriptional regulator [Kiritimatiellia bacterium]